jgi:ribonuclease HI
MERIVAYVDGACKGNPGPGGYGAIVVYPKSKKEMSAGFEDTTNSRMELMAVQTVLGLFYYLLNSEDVKKYDITIISDSRYVVDSFTKGWLEKWATNGWVRSDGSLVANKDLWQNILMMLREVRKAGFIIRFEWIRGHGSNEHHKACDKLASTAATCQSCFCEREIL